MKIITNKRKQGDLCLTSFGYYIGGPVGDTNTWIHVPPISVCLGQGKQLGARGRTRNASARSTKEVWLWNLF